MKLKNENNHHSFFLSFFSFLFFFFSFLFSFLLFPHPLIPYSSSLIPSFLFLLLSSLSSLLFHLSSLPLPSSLSSSLPIPPSSFTSWNRLCDWVLIEWFDDDLVLRNGNGMEEGREMDWCMKKWMDWMEEWGFDMRDGKWNGKWEMGSGKLEVGWDEIWYILI